MTSVANGLPDLATNPLRLESGRDLAQTAMLLLAQPLSSLDDVGIALEHPVAAGPADASQLCDYVGLLERSQRRREPDESTRLSPCPDSDQRCVEFLQVVVASARTE
jgi:hypothetical protein